ncbi:hypothetical protein INT46_005582 [Mucor plumbeus]|uniref:Uncharacterized protein n=1 Tax=Mucor plumbeus TaxID=97098 RepID=A0A8H7VAU1_9FUNG|nr:hypothetical protein INT46_005582 [Mucor plumbeus]
MLSSNTRGSRGGAHGRPTKTAQNDTEPSTFAPSMSAGIAEASISLIFEFTANKMDVQFFTAALLSSGFEKTLCKAMHRQWKVYT